MSVYVKTDDGSNTINNGRYGETYHSVNGAYTETQHVFLDGTGVAQRLKNGSATRVLEIGFGLGLNALLTADLAKTHKATLEYHSYEHDLVDADVIERLAYSSLLESPDLAKTLVEYLAKRIPAERESSHLDGAISSDLPGVSDDCPAGPTPDTRRNDVESLNATYALRSFRLAQDISLSIHCKDASTASLIDDTGGQFDAIYLDAFSPVSNPECWSERFFHQLKQALSSTGCLSTYSAKGDVRRSMLAAGLKVHKAPGPPGKREMLIARAA